MTKRAPIQPPQPGLPIQSPGPASPRHRPVPARLQRALAGHVPQIYTHPDTLLVAFAFECNLACTFCMVQDALDTFGGTPLSTFRAFAEDREAMAGIKRVILSGGEVTLDSQLLRYVEVARSVTGVQHVRVQTNATRLHDRGFLRRLVDAGVDEFFVSLHGHNAQVCDAITQRTGSFKAIMRGIEAISASDASWISNTCIVRRNVAFLPDIVELAHGAGAAACELWNVWPRVDDAALREEIVPVARIQPSLMQALQKSREHGLKATVKWYPRCLLGEFGACCDDSQPTALIDDEYWQKLPQYDCLFAGVCADGQRCAGLSHAYVERHGWEAATLLPNRDLSSAPPADRRGAMAAAPGARRAADRHDPMQHDRLDKQAQPGQAGQQARDSDAAAIAPLAGLEIDTVCGGWTLAQVQPTSNGARLRWATESGSHGDAWVRLAPLNPAHKSLAAVGEWALSYERVEGDAGHLVALVLAVAEHLRGDAPG